MSVSRIMQQAAAGAAGGGAVYVDDVFSTYLYAGNNASRTITNGIDLSGEGGMVWLKARSESQNHALYDTERGATKSIYSSTNGAEGTLSGVSAFNSNGFDLGTVWNSNNQDYVSWTFRKQPGFFDVVTYTGNGTNRTISHNLGCKPGLIIIKATSMSAGWMVGAGFTSTQYYRLALETSGAASGGGLANYNNYLSAEPTTTTFSLGNEGLGNANGQTYVAYLFANDAQDFGEDSDEAIIKCGSYTGNGSSTGPTIDLGFEPQWLMIKKASGAAGWYMYDNMRGVATGGNDALLYADANNSEAGSQNIVDFTSSGFQIVNADGDINANGASHIYMAIRRPHKPASEFAATDLFGIDNNTGQTGVNTNVLTDFGFVGNRTTTDKWYVGSRLTQGTVLNFSSTAAQSTSSIWNWDQMQGMFKDTGTWNGHIGYGLRRAPGFFDVVAYEGNQTARQIPHNLGVAPEMMWVKCRSQTRNWAVYHASQGNTKVAQLNSADSFTADTSSWNNTSPTSTHFTVGDSATTNFNPEPMIAYLFASVPGISKVGSYTATGSNLNIDCGFTNGARFVLIKWASDVSSWYLWDSVRGIVAGTDPYLRLNTTNAETTTSDWIDPLSSGFTVTNAAGNDVNNNGGTYIFYAIA